MPAAPFTIVLLLLSLLLSAPLPSGSAHAVTPEEMLADPALEKRARDLSKNLRCLVCQNQSIDDSDADLARDLRLEVRRRLADGETDAAILAAIRGLRIAEPARVAGNADPLDGPSGDYCRRGVVADCHAATTR